MAGAGDEAVSRDYTPPRVLIHGVSAAGWFMSYLSLAAWARHGRGICSHCEVIEVHVVGDLAT